MVEEKTLDRASRYLAYKPRTRKELCRYLKDHGVGTQEAEECADLLEEYHLLDDLEYARVYAESMLQRGRGLERIRRELAQKGISRNTIEDGLALLEEMPDEDEAALEQAKDLLLDEDLVGMDYHEKQKLKSRIAGRLSRQGYRMETVYRAVREAFEQTERDQREYEE